MLVYFISGIQYTIHNDSATIWLVWVINEAPKGRSDYVLKFWIYVNFYMGTANSNPFSQFTNGKYPLSVDRWLF